MQGLRGCDRNMQGLKISKVLMIFIAYYFGPISICKSRASKICVQI